MVEGMKFGSTKLYGRAGQEPAVHAARVASSCPAQGNSRGNLTRDSRQFRASFPLFASGLPVTSWKIWIFCCVTENAGTGLELSVHDLPREKACW